MASIAVIAVEGVLARVGQGKLAEARLIAEGVNLFTALKKVYRVVLLTHEHDEEKAEQWLRTQGIHGHVSLWGPLGIDDAQRRVRLEQLMELRSRGMALALYVDESPSAVAGAMEMGITGLVFASPVYARPEFRPDAQTTLRPWDEISAAVGRQNELRAREPVATADLHE